MKKKCIRLCLFPSLVPSRRDKPRRKQMGNKYSGAERRPGILPFVEPVFGGKNRKNFV